MDSLTERKKKRISWWKGHRKQKGGEDLTEKSEKKKKETHKKEEPNVKEKEEDAKAENKRYILFVGNLPFHVEANDVKAHFSCTGGVKEFRLMTKKSGESKGCGFLELENQPNLWKALKLHHSKLQGRRINVEVTCGGGGSGEDRRKKLKMKKQRLKKARQTSIKNKDSENLKTDAQKVPQQETRCNSSYGEDTSSEKQDGNHLDISESVSAERNKKTW